MLSRIRKKSNIDNECSERWLVHDGKQKGNYSLDVSTSGSTDEWEVFETLLTDMKSGVEISALSATGVLPFENVLIAEGSKPSLHSIVL